jgi:hypothetical protein
MTAEGLASGRPRGVWVSPAELTHRESLQDVLPAELGRLSPDAQLILIDLVLRVDSARQALDIEVEHARQRGKDGRHVPGVQWATEVVDAVRNALRFALYYGMNAPVHQALPGWELSKVTHVADELTALAAQRRQQSRQRLHRELKEHSHGFI